MTASGNYFGSGKGYFNLKPTGNKMICNLFNQIFKLKLNPPLCHLLKQNYSEMEDIEIKPCHLSTRLFVKSIVLLIRLGLRHEIQFNLTALCTYYIWNQALP